MLALLGCAHDRVARASGELCHNRDFPGRDILGQRLAMGGDLACSTGLGTCTPGVGGERITKGKDLCWDRIFPVIIETG